MCLLNGVHVFKSIKLLGCHECGLCQANEAPTHVYRDRDDFPQVGLKSFWAMRRVTRINCGTLSKTARVGRRTWTRATPRDAMRRLRHCSRIVARRLDF